MNYLLSDAPQGTDAWRQARAGRATGSRASDITAKIKTGEAATRRNYRIQLVTERLICAPAEDGFVNDAMRWGTEQEPFARMAYEAETGELVREAGFAYLPNIMAGCSVDGFIGDDGILECKCPKSATHVMYLLDDRLPPEYEPQVLHNLWITGAKFADFVSFDPRLPEQLRFLRVRVERDEAKIDAYVGEVMKFLAEVDQLETRLRARSPFAVKEAA